MSLLRDLWPDAVRVDGRERLRACAGALLGVLIAGALGWFASRHAEGALWLIAPLGASAVLVFCVPASPMAQPWPVVGGNVIASAVGMGCALLPLPVPISAALAVAIAIAAMFATRSLHPPGGAAALLAVLTAQGGWSYLLFPVAFNCVLLVSCGALYNSLTGRRYPHPRQVATAGGRPSRFSAADLDAALAHYNQYLDVSRHDLAELLHHAESAAYQRQLGALRCADVMTREVLTADEQMPLADAWRLMRERRIKALPVVDAARRLVGIVTAGDFLARANLDSTSGLAQRLLALLRPRAGTDADRLTVVGQVMTRNVQVVDSERPLLELLALLAQAGHHHIPIVDAGQRLVGIITQTDLVRALYRAVAAPPA